MSELSEIEFWFIKTRLIPGYGFGIGHEINLIDSVMKRIGFMEVRKIIDSLIKKKVLNISPDGRRVKLTDYGIELYQSRVNEQKEWDSQPFIRISQTEHNQILVRAGETFKANRILREIFKQAKEEICILDAYFGTKLFDLLEESNNHIRIRIVTSDKSSKGTFTTYRDYRKQYPQVELRVAKSLEAKFHDRFIFIDKLKGFHSGHSFKDLGEKDSQINFIKDPREQISLFEERWSMAESVD